MIPLAQALSPVRDALLAASHEHADSTTAQADAEAARILAAAKERVESIRQQARERGIARATAQAVTDRAHARREARSKVLEARRQAYEALTAGVQSALSELSTRPEYAPLRAALVAVAGRVLGPGAAVRDAPGGGITAEVPGRRLDLSLAGFAARAAEAYAPRLWGDEP